MALFAAMIRAGGWPDVGYTLCQVVGFPCVGDYRDSGLFRRVDEPAAVRPGQLSNAGQIAHVDKALRSAAVRAQADDAKRNVLHEITSQTRLEVNPDPASGKPQVAFGPYTVEEVDGLLGGRVAPPSQVLHRTRHS